MNLRCPLQDQCSGCDQLHLNSQEQKSKKIANFQQNFRRENLPIEFHSFGNSGLRSRLDFILADGKTGLYQKNSREIVDIESCLQLEPALQNFYQEFRQISWPIRKGSVRLRVSPTGQKGAWLDFANEDIKKLLIEETSLLKLQELAFVEIGQKHKTLIRKKSGELGLGDPTLNSWFQTWMSDQSVPLFSTVASFTQPSHVANKTITQTLSRMFLQIKPHHVLEFGAGIGNLTFPALSYKETKVTATDVDTQALSGLKLSLEKMKLENRVSIQSGDFRILKPDIKNLHTLLLNPARNGVGGFLDTLLPMRPQHLIYMSCFQKSFFEDIQKLTDYSISEIHLMDQFPNTSHVEILAKFDLR